MGPGPLFRKLDLVPIFLVVAQAAWAGAIDTTALEQPWPKQRVRETEVGRYPVTWREKANRREGIFAGVRFSAPLDRQAVWDLAADYGDIGSKTPGVTAVRMVEQSETRQVIEVDAKVLWKTLTLRFEVERDPPKAMRFRLTDELLGEYRGVCRFEPTATGTDVEMATWLKPSRPVPIGLILLVERMTFLQGVKGFLEACEPRSSASPRAGRVPSLPRDDQRRPGV